jgi:hypothetical protein
MPTRFRPLEQIADDPSVKEGDMIVVRGHFGTGGIFRAVPVIYAGLDVRVSDGSRSVPRGKEIPGINVFYRWNKEGEPVVDSQHRPYEPAFIPFSHVIPNEYALLIEAEYIPR